MFWTTLENKWVDKNGHDDHGRGPNSVWARARATDKQATEEARQRNAEPAAQDSKPDAATIERRRSLVEVNETTAKAMKEHFNLEPEDIGAIVDIGVEGIHIGKVKVNYKEADDGTKYLSFICKASTHEGGGKVVFELQRGLTKGPKGNIVNHNSFFIEPEFQGKGIAAHVYAEGEKAYAKAGMEAIRTHANGTVGRYAWAQHGFDFANDESRDEVLLFARNHLKIAGLEQYTEHVNKVKHSWDLANLKAPDGKKYSIRDINPSKAEVLADRGVDVDTKTHIGKALMLISPYWDGVKSLKEGSDSVRIATAYRNKKPPITESKAVNVKGPHEGCDPETGDDLMFHINELGYDNGPSKKSFWDILELKFDPSKHPRDSNGKFAKKPGGGAAPKDKSHDGSFDGALKILTLAKGHAKYQAGKAKEAHAAGNQSAVDKHLATLQKHLTTAENMAKYAEGLGGTDDIGKKKLTKLIDDINKSGAEAHAATGKAPQTAQATAKPKAVEPKSAAAPTQAPVTNGAKPLALTELTPVGGQAGSNLGGKFKDKDGQEWYIKSPQTNDHVFNEVLASKLYALAGVNGPEVHAIDMNTQIGGQSPKADFGVASKYVNGLQQDPSALKPGGKAHDKVVADFAVHAWLGNWDAIGTGYDNMLLDKDGNPRLVDVGGSLLFRAQGTPKGDAFGDKVAELDNLKNPAVNEYSAAVFGKMTKEQMVASMERVANIMPNKITEMVNESGLPSDKKIELAKKLAARQEDIVDRMYALKAEIAAEKAPKPSPAAINPNSAGVQAAQSPSLKPVYVAKQEGGLPMKKNYFDVKAGKEIMPPHVGAKPDKKTIWADSMAKHISQGHKLPFTTEGYAWHSVKDKGPDGKEKYRWELHKNVYKQDVEQGYNGVSNVKKPASTSLTGYKPVVIDAKPPTGSTPAKKTTLIPNQSFDESKQPLQVPGHTWFKVSNGQATGWELHKDENAPTSKDLGVKPVATTVSSSKPMNQAGYAWVDAGNGYWAKYKIDSNAAPPNELNTPSTGKVGTTTHATGTASYIPPGSATKVPLLDSNTLLKASKKSQYGSENYNGYGTPTGHDKKAIQDAHIKAAGVDSKIVQFINKKADSWTLDYVNDPSSQARKVLNEWKEYVKTGKPPEWAQAFEAQSKMAKAAGIDAEHYELYRGVHDNPKKGVYYTKAVIDAWASGADHVTMTHHEIMSWTANKSTSDSFAGQGVIFKAKIPQENILVDPASMPYAMKRHPGEHEFIVATPKPNMLAPRVEDVEVYYDGKKYTYAERHELFKKAGVTPVAKKSDPRIDFDDEIPDHNELLQKLNIPRPEGIVAPPDLSLEPIGNFGPRSQEQ